LARGGKNRTVFADFCAQFLRKRLFVALLRGISTNFFEEIHSFLFTPY